MSRIRIPLAQPQPLRLPLFYRVKRQSQNRFYAEFVPKAPINFKKPVTRIFDETSKPRPYMRTERDLPPVKVSTLITSLPVHSLRYDIWQKRWPMLIAMSTFTIASWAAFYAFHINKEKLSTSVVRQLLYTISHDKELAAVLGDNVNIQPRWWVNGRGWVNGAVSPLFETALESN